MDNHVRLVVSKTGSTLIISILLLGLLFKENRWVTAEASPDASATFTVLNTNDSGAGSLRQAILSANLNPGADMIVFNIGSGGVRRISPRSPLPTITGPVTIDGTTQPGLSSTTSIPSDGTTQQGIGTTIVELDGTNAGATANGLFITAGDSVVKGLAIGNFNGHAISLQQRGNNMVMNNFLGTNASCDEDRGNAGEGVNIQNSSNNSIMCNTIVFNGDGGSIINSSGNVIQDNNLGTDATMTRNKGNRGAGFGFLNASDNQFLENRVGFNRLGIIGRSGAGNLISRNLFVDSGTAIDLAPNGVNPNDAGDGDSGPNTLQNFPLLTSASSDGINTTIRGTLNSTRNTTFRIEFFASPMRNELFSQGSYCIGNIDVVTDQQGNANFVATLPRSVPAGHEISATATGPGGNTSEFSGRREVQGDADGTGLTFYPFRGPIRVLDTRPGAQACVTPGTPLTGRWARKLQVSLTTCERFTIPADARAVTGSATVINALNAPGSLWLYPNGAPQPTAANFKYLSNQTGSCAYTVELGSDGAFNIATSSSTHVIVDITGYYAPPGTGGLYFHPLPHPVRLLDTRPNEAACNTPGTPLMGGGVFSQQAIGICDGINIPADARAIACNGTVVNSFSTAGYITLYPGGTSQPIATNHNYLPNSIVPNAFIVGLGNDGKFNIYSHASTHFIVDVAGYFSPQASDINGPGLMYVPLPYPVRLLDTRPDRLACNTTRMPLMAGAVFSQQALGTCGGINIPAGARAIAGNATVVNFFATSGYISLYPGGVALPITTNLTYPANSRVSNPFITGLGNDGKFNIYSHSSTHFILDITGYFAP